MDVTWGEVYELMKLIASSNIFPDQTKQYANMLYDKLRNLSVIPTDEDKASAFNTFKQDIYNGRTSHYYDLIQDYNIELESYGRKDLTQDLPIEGIDFFPDYQPEVKAGFLVDPLDRVMDLFKPINNIRGNDPGFYNRRAAELSLLMRFGISPYR